MTDPVRLTEATAGTATEDPQSANEAFHDPDSLSGRVDAVHRIFADQFPSREEGPFNFVEEIYEDRILARVNEQTVQIAYTFNGDDPDNPITFEQPEKVKVTLDVEVIEAGADPKPEHFTADFATTIIEALDEAEGRIWRVTMVRPGISKNGRRYTPEVLAEAVHLYEGARSFDGHRDASERRKSAVANMTGWHENVTAAADGSLISDFHISESREDIRQLFLTAWKNKRPDLIGFSHDVSALTEAAVVGGRRISDVRKIVEVHSVDVVADPSAGGQIERLVASRQEEETMKLEDFLKALRSEELTAEQLAEAIEEHPEWEQIAEAFKAEKAAAGERIKEAGEPAKPEPKDDDDDEPLTGAVRELVIESAITKAGLPQAAHERLNEALEGAETEAAILATIKETKSIWDSALAATPAQLPGQVAVKEDDADKLRHGLDAMIFGEEEREGIPAFKGIKEAYAAFTGRSPYQMGDEDFNRWVFAESAGGLPYAGAERLLESLTTASWVEALGDSITRRLIAEYRDNSYSSWRMIASDITNPPDFRTNRRVRIGGYDVLPTVAESGPYTALTSPTDEEASFAVTKKGGTEDFTLEMVANDDLGGLRRIPRNLGRAAALTLYRAVWNTTIAANALIFDAVALFDSAGHDNDEATTPLDEAGIAILRRKMIRQTMPGETSGYVGLIPKTLAVPPELFVEAFKLANSAVAVVGTGESATTPNPFQGLTVLELPTLTDVNDWYLFADPASVPMLEVGFYQGRQDPELLIQDQPAVGAVFSNDEFTWKIRHIWGLTVLDFRGFQRATQV